MFSLDPQESAAKFFDLTIVEAFSGLPVESAQKFFDLTVFPVGTVFSGNPIESALKFFDLRIYVTSTDAAQVGLSTHDYSLISPITGEESIMSPLTYF